MSNTTDPFVPALDRHTFTPCVKKQGSEKEPQPFFEHTDKDAFTETWNNYIFVAEDITNAQLVVSADDNASAYLYAFPDKIAEVTPLTEDKDYGGGQFRPCDPIPVIAELKKGYYRIHIQYENVNYPGANAARLEVKLDGKQVVVGDLSEENLFTELDAKKLMKCYNKYNYKTMKTHAEFWTTIGIKGSIDLGANDASCAARISQALGEYGVNLDKEPNLNNGGRYLDSKNKEGKVIYIRALSIHNYMMEKLGKPMFTSKAEFDKMRIETGGTPIILWSEFVGRYAHVGMGYSAEGSAEQGTFEDVQSMWVLFRPDFEDPETSVL